VRQLHGGHLIKSIYNALALGDSVHILYICNWVMEYLLINFSVRTNFCYRFMHIISSKTCSQIIFYL
jgi:hypothetical protein